MHLVHPLPEEENVDLLPQNKQRPLDTSTIKNTTNTVWKLSVTGKRVTTSLPHSLGSPTSDDNFLPDLVALSPRKRTNPLNTCGVVTSNATQPAIPIISLVSLPAIICTSSPPRSAPHVEPTQTISNLNDLQSTLEFSNNPVPGSDAVDQLISELPSHTRNTTVPDQRDREVVTLDSIETNTECTGVFSQSSPKQCSTPKQSARHQKEQKDQKVVTPKDKTDPHTLMFAVENHSYATPKTPTHIDSNENSQGFSSPRSVVTEPDQQEIDTTNILIQMSNATMEANETIPTSKLCNRQRA